MRGQSAADIFVFQTFAIAGLLPIIAGVLIISGNPIALGLLSIAHSLPILSSIFGIENIIGQLYPATILARLVTLELKVGSECLRAQTRLLNEYAHDVLYWHLTDIPACSPFLLSGAKRTSRNSDLRSAYDPTGTLGVTGTKVRYALLGAPEHLLNVGFQG